LKKFNKGHIVKNTHNEQAHCFSLRLMRSEGFILNNTF